jgi:hypothetical protein
MLLGAFIYVSLNVPIHYRCIVGYIQSPYRWLIIYGFTSRSRIFHLYGDVDICLKEQPRHFDTVVQTVSILVHRMCISSNSISSVILNIIFQSMLRGCSMATSILRSQNSDFKLSFTFKEMGIF